MSAPSTTQRPLRVKRLPAAALACAATVAACALATATPPAFADDTGAAAATAVAGATSSTGTGGSTTKPPATAALEQCLTTTAQAERSATFVGEMTAVAGAKVMEMQIGLLERLPGELDYHAVDAPGLGAWQRSAPGVKVYKSLDQVTNLTAPADYRGLIRFRWLSAHGRTIKTLELRTPRCSQTDEAAADSTTTTATGTATGTSGG